MSFINSIEFYLLLIPCLFLLRVIFLFKNIYRLSEIFLLLFNAFFIYILFNKNLLLLALLFSLAALTFIAASFVKTLKIAPLLTILGIICLVLVLAVAKYSLFQPINAFLAAFLNLKTPFTIIGISYLIFKLIHFFTDTVQGGIEKPSFLKFLNYLFFMPCYLSGPLDRYERFSSDLDSLCQKNAGKIFLAKDDVQNIFRFSVGLFKKMSLVSILTPYSINQLKITAASPTPLNLIIIGCYAYSFVLYFDFSGYSDMAIALSRILGIKTPENFNYPYSSFSIQEFWTRWHITLSNWIRDFIFYPLNKYLQSFAPTMRTVIFPAVSILIAFTLCGIWHGDGLNFLLWGFGHGAALSIYFIYRDFMKRHFRKQYDNWRGRLLYKCISWFITFHFIVFINLLLGLTMNKFKTLVSFLLG